MKVVFPMAGRGSRFHALKNENPEYEKPKPLILIKDQPMIAWALKSFPLVSSSNLIFIILSEHEKNYHMTEVLKRLCGEDITVITIDTVTRGAVETVLCAKEYINSAEDLLIADCDNYFDGTPLFTAIQNKSDDTVGIIPVFKPADSEPKWSYTLFDENNTAIAVGEKDEALAQKGAYANIGAYYFSSGKLFVKEAEKMITENATYGTIGKEEFYIAPLYERLIVNEKKVKVAIVDTFWGLGTPKDVDYFLKHFSF